MDNSAEIPETKYVSCGSSQLNKILDFLRENLEIPKGVRELTLHIKYCPTFKGTVEEGKDTDGQ